MPVGDYQVSQDCAFEYKSPADFLSSQVGEEKLKVNRQIGDLVQSYPKPALLIGGSLDEILFLRRIQPNAIFGMLESIIWKGCPVRFLKNEQITANYIFETSKKEQGEGKDSNFCPHGQKTKRNEDEQKIFTVSSINNIGTATARDLLKHFGNIKKIANADLEELQEVPGIGEKTAMAIRENLQGVFWGKK